MAHATPKYFVGVVLLTQRLVAVDRLCQPHSRQVHDDRMIGAPVRIVGDQLVHDGLHDALRVQLDHRFPPASRAAMRELSQSINSLSIQPFMRPLSLNLMGRGNSPRLIFSSNWVSEYPVKSKTAGRRIMR